MHAYGLHAETKQRCCSVLLACIYEQLLVSTRCQLTVADTAAAQCCCACWCQVGTLDFRVQELELELYNTQYLLQTAQVGCAVIRLMPIAG